MADLVKCSVCGKEYSSAAKECPHCGDPNVVCPKCGSRNVKERTGRERGNSVMMFGVFGAKSAMCTHKCQDCGHKF